MFRRSNKSEKTMRSDKSEESRRESESTIVTQPSTMSPTQLSFISEVPEDTFRLSTPVRSKSFPGGEPSARPRLSKIRSFSSLYSKKRSAQSYEPNSPTEQRAHSLDQYRIPSSYASKRSETPVSILNAQPQSPQRIASPVPTISSPPLSRRRIATPIPQSSGRPQTAPNRGRSLSTPEITPQIRRPSRISLQSTNSAPQVLLDQQNDYIVSQQQVISKLSKRVQDLDELIQRQRHTISILTSKDKPLPHIPNCAFDEPAPSPLELIAEEIVDGFDALSVNSDYLDTWAPSPPVTRKKKFPAPPMTPLPTPPRVNIAPTTPLPTPPRVNIAPIKTNGNAPTISIKKAEKIEKPERTTKEVRFVDEGKFECESPVIPSMFEGLTPPGSPAMLDFSLDACVQEFRAGGSWCLEPNQAESLNLDRILLC
ncbi:hypothetical protein BZA77DRAFT_318205 [Pyronema omphalodes]|nr:hypothetical protein BZA77DRAFT_318205 [Pyronema omphalodes]